MMEQMNSVKNAIIPGKKNKLKIILSSHLAGDYDSCDAELTETSCLKCDNNKMRKLIGNTCYCEEGWYDPGAE